VRAIASMVACEGGGADLHVEQAREERPLAAMAGTAADFKAAARWDDTALAQTVSVFFVHMGMCKCVIV